MGYIVLSCVLVVLSLVLYFSVRGYESTQLKTNEEKQEERKRAEMFNARFPA